MIKNINKNYIKVLALILLLNILIPVKMATGSNPLYDEVEGLLDKRDTPEYIEKGGFTIRLSDETPTNEFIASFELIVHNNISTY